ncbi:BTG [Parelaphostrongylus tenuis]|uniref:BTG n=1 Tax=Parelaphostrongylus tenuis TaxID=148309 RepID=A0AAD5N694_PARTN|nr:BTG [Parelaphostrongylus tenuis]KAJ1358799.1 BTG [Parelaphostrongylus tenuis]
MYTELKELVNFLALYLLGIVPRRPASLFICQLANHLVHRFRGCQWDINNPKKDEQRRIVRLKVSGFTDQLITLAATEIGLSAEEILECLPDNIFLYINPGEVYYRAGEGSPPVPIWTGKAGVDPDLT